MKNYELAKSRKKQTPTGESISRRSVLKGITATGVAALASNLSLAETEKRKFDFIVVGSGPGGGPLACNLAKAGYSVCLMEAGSPALEPDVQQLINVPLFFAKASADPEIAWDYFVRHYADEAQAKKDTKFVPEKGGVLYPRASTIGGCSVHNASIMLYPSNSDWEYISDTTGDQSWAPDRMRKYFERLEQCRYTKPEVGDENTARHGFRGWQPIEMPEQKIFQSDPQVLELMQAAESVLGEPGDLNALLHNRLDPNDYRTTQKDKQGLYNVPMSRQNEET